MKYQLTQPGKEQIDKYIFKKIILMLWILVTYSYISSFMQIHKQLQI